MGVLQCDLAIAVVSFAAKLEAGQHVLAEWQDCGVIGVQVGLDVPVRGLALSVLICRASHDGLVRECRMTALDAEIMCVQCIPGARIQQPRLSWLPMDE